MTLIRGGEVGNAQCGTRRGRCGTRGRGALGRCNCEHGTSQYENRKNTPERRTPNLVDILQDFLEELGQGSSGQLAYSSDGGGRVVNPL